MNFADLLPVGLTIIAVVVALGIGASVLASIDAGQTGVAKNITGTGLLSLKGLVTWLPTIALVVAMAIIIGLIVNAFRIA